MRSNLAWDTIKRQFVQDIYMDIEWNTKEGKKEKRNSSPTLFSVRKNLSGLKRLDLDQTYWWWTRLPLPRQTTYVSFCLLTHRSWMYKLDLEEIPKTTISMEF